MSFLSKINPKYLHVSFECKIGPPKDERSRKGRLKVPYDLEKIKSYIVTTKETSVRGLKRFALCYKKTVIHKR